MCDQQFPANPDCCAASSTSTAPRTPYGDASSHPAPRGESTRKVKWPPGKGWGKSFCEDINKLQRSSIVSMLYLFLTERCLSLRQIGLHIGPLLWSRLNMSPTIRQFMLQCRWISFTSDPQISPLVLPWCWCVVITITCHNYSEDCPDIWCRCSYPLQDEL